MRILFYMILGIITNYTILEVKEYYEMNKFMDCFYYQSRTKQNQNICYQYLDSFYYPDRPYLSECLYAGNKNCELFGVERKKFE